MKLNVEFSISDKTAKCLEGLFAPSETLNEILQGVKKLMSNQEQFDAQITAANTALDAIAAAVAAEAQQIADFIAANPAVDTSALAGVVTRLEAADDAISNVFTEPVVDPPTEEPVP